MFNLFFSWKKIERFRSHICSFCKGRTVLIGKGNDIVRKVSENRSEVKFKKIFSKKETSDKGHNQQGHTCKIPTNEFTFSKVAGLSFASLLKHNNFPISFSANYVKKATSKDFTQSSEVCGILKLISSARHLEVCADKHFIQKI